jgi:glycosyltransferase involved in cell wall biosynthesis
MITSDTEIALSWPEHSPYFADVGVLALVPDEWTSNWLGRHQILTRLAQYFHVLWCAPPKGWRQREWWRERWLGDRQQTDEINNICSPGLSIYCSDKWFPAIGRPRFVARWSERERLRFAQQILLKRGCRKFVLYLCRPEYETALELVRHDLSCYHIADEYSLSEIEQPIDSREARLIARVDQMFIHSIAMLEKKGKLNPQTEFIPNGVDYDAFATPHPEPDDLKSIPHPRIGYVGRVKQRLNLALVIELAKHHRGWSFIFVGAQDGIGNHAGLLQQFAKMPNVHVIGGKPVSALPGYTQHMDVCLLPYEINGYTKFIYPLKLHEYLASGRPVVGSPIRTLEEFAQIIRLARTTDEWSQAIEQSLSDEASSADKIDARQRVARQHDWDRLIRRIAQTMCGRLGSDYLERFAKILPATASIDS